VPPEPPSKPFANWLNATMLSRGLSQAQLARVVGVADTQVSRWRRGQVVPTVHYLQRIADTLDVPRVSLDRLAGYPVGEAEPDAPPDADPERQAELHAYGAAYRQLLEHGVPRPLWGAFADACAALAGSMSGAYQEALARSLAGAGDRPAPEATRPAGFRR
jgi:transcriptional regulator with XRE-family HTH domain